MERAWNCFGFSHKRLILSNLAQWHNQECHGYTSHSNYRLSNGIRNALLLVTLVNWLNCPKTLRQKWPAWQKTVDILMRAFYILQPFSLHLFQNGECVSLRLGGEGWNSTPETGGDSRKWRWIPLAPLFTWGVMQIDKYWWIQMESDWFKWI